MPLEFRHPDEQALHHQLRDALNRNLTSKDFFVWISVVPSGEASEIETLDAIVAATDQWLAHLSPDAVQPQAMPEQRFIDRAGEVQIHAVPKKPEARGQRAKEIVGNPEPILVGYAP
jgi:hypothetical protein